MQEPIIEDDDVALKPGEKYPDLDVLVHENTAVETAPLPEPQHVDSGMQVPPSDPQLQPEVSAVPLGEPQSDQQATQSLESQPLQPTPVPAEEYQSTPTVPTTDPHTSHPLYKYTKGGAKERTDSLTSMDGQLSSQLERMLADAPPEVRDAVQIGSAFRSNETQAKIFADAVAKYGSEAEARKWAAPPGKSNHNHGLAADLNFKTDAAKAWFHQNAPKYGLAFPMKHEPWHIETADARSRRQEAFVPAADRYDASTRVKMERAMEINQSPPEERQKLYAFGAIESNYGRNLINPISTARGVFQITEATWAEQGNGKDVMDAEANTDAAIRYSRQNAAQLKKAMGRPPSIGEEYMAWQQGAGGATKLLQNPNAPAASLIGQAAFGGNVPASVKRSNPNWQNMTAGEFTKLYVDKINAVMGRRDNSGPIPHVDLNAPSPSPVSVAWTEGTRTRDLMIAREQGAEIMGNTLKAIGHEWSNNTLTGQLLQFGSQRYFPPDANWQLNPADFNDLPKQFHSRFETVKSQAELYHVRDTIRTDMEMQQHLSDAGWVGTAASIITQFADPAAIAAGAASGALAASAAQAFKAGLGSSRTIAAVGGAAGNLAIDYGIAKLGDKELTPTQAALSVALGAGFGAMFGPLGRNPATQREAFEIAAIAHKSADDVSQAALMAGSGEARAASSLADNIADTEAWKALSDDDVAKAAFGNYRMTIGGKLAASDNPVMRSIGGILTHDAVGKPGDAINPFGADQFKRKHGTAVEKAWISMYRPAYVDFAKANGLNSFQIMAGTKKPEFDAQIIKYISEPNSITRSQAPDYIRRAGDEFARIMNHYAENFVDPQKLMGRSGSRAVKGMENITPDPHYIPRLWAQGKILAAQEKHGTDAVYDAIANAIRVKQPEIDPKLATRFAHAVIDNKETRRLGIDSKIMRGLADGDEAEFTRLLKETGHFNDAEAAELIKQLKKPATNEGSASFTKRRILMDESYVHPVTGLAIRDLLEGDLDKIMGNYINKASGELALANMRITHPQTGELLLDGITSDADFDKVLRMAYEWAKANNVSTEKLAKEIELARFAYDRIKGRPLESQMTDGAFYGRVLRQFNTARLMNQVGFAQLMDLGRPVGMLGVRSFLQNMSAFRHMSTQDGKWVLKHGLDRDLEQMFGLGVENVRGLRSRIQEHWANPEAVAAYGLKEKVAAVTDTMAATTMSISGMNAVNSWVQFVTGRMVMGKFAELAMSTKALSKSDRLMVRNLGLSDEMLDRISAQIRSHGEFTEGSLFGRKLATNNLDKWTDAEARANYENAVFRMTHSMIQTNDVGSMARWMSHPTAQLLTQFRTYNLVAYENQMLQGINGMRNGDMRHLIGFSASFMSALVVYWAQAQLRAIGRSDRDEYLKKNLWGDDGYTPWVTNALGRSGFMSMLPSVLDTGLVWTGHESIFNGARATQQPMDLITGNPSAGLYTSLTRSSRSLFDSVSEGRQQTQSEMRNHLSNVPFGNWMPLANLYSFMIKDRPEK